MCSEEECRDRQLAMEVSEWEATSDTFFKPPKARIMDPCLAVSKYRRSAAGTKQRKPRKLTQLLQTWKHLQQIMLHQKIHTDQTPRAWAVVASFLDDRIRAIQVDLVVSQQVSGALQVQFVRYQLISLYLLAGVSRTIFEPKFAKLALMTALVAYWNDADSDRHDDDEILCYTTLCHVAATLSDSSWVEGETTLAPYRQHASKDRSYPKFTLALKIAAAVHAQQYYVALKVLSETSSLYRLCMAPCLNRIRWLCLRHYNTAFMKREKLLPDDVARLLYLSNGQAAMEFCTNAGFPEEGGFIVFKAAPIQELQSYHINRTMDDWFCLGPSVDYRLDSDKVKIPSQEVLQQLIVPDDSE